MTDKCPGWRYKTPIDIVRFLMKNQVHKVEAGWWHDGFGIKSDDWFILHSANSKKTAKAPANLFTTGEIEIEARSGELVHARRDLLDTIEAIDKWNSKNAAERRQYERLKKKFETATN